MDEYTYDANLTFKIKVKMCDKTDLRIKHLGVNNSDNFVTKFDWEGK